jgi:cell division protein FtsW (lipid II flippase)
MESSKIVSGFIGVIVLMALVAGFYPTLISYGNDLNKSGMPFASFLADGGLAWLVLGIMVFVGALGLIGYKVAHK